VQEYQRGGWTILAGGRVGFGGWNALTPIDNFAANGSLLCDNFNRPDAGLGVNWATSAGTAAIVANQAVGGTGGMQSRSELLGSCGAGAACYADCNNDGGLTIADFGCFQTKFCCGMSIAIFFFA
jgi:hypothetical protein